MAKNSVRLAQIEITDAEIMIDGRVFPLERCDITIEQAESYGILDVVATPSSRLKRALRWLGIVD